MKKQSQIRISCLVSRILWDTEIPFLLHEGENPDNFKLNLVVGGKGTVWIDDIRLLKGPFKQYR